jgi:1-acyl-sn-glycerol-3-phosphate acyltransferase
MSAFAFGLRSRLFLKLTGLARLAADHEAANRLPAGRFEDRALQILGIPIEARGLDHVPRTGPLVIVANHPHGALDGRCCRRCG